MVKNEHKLRAKVWLYPGMAGWHFLTLPKGASAEIKNKYKKVAKGWGSLPVKVTIGKTSWKTSIFPDTRSASYLLPLKAEIRKKEHIGREDIVNFTIQIG